MNKRIVILLDPKMCTTCRFSEEQKFISEVDGKLESFVICNRKDCDNWDTTSSIPVTISDIFP